MGNASSVWWLWERTGDVLSLRGPLSVGEPDGQSRKWFAKIGSSAHACNVQVSALCGASSFRWSPGAALTIHAVVIIYYQSLN